MMIIKEVKGRKSEDNVQGCSMRSKPLVRIECIIINSRVNSTMK